MESLSNCPFCGREMKIRTLHNKVTGDMHVISHDDYAQIPCVLYRGLTWNGSAEEFITLWNRRASDGIH